MIYSFGRKDQPDIGAINRLAKSLCRFASPEQALKNQAQIESDQPLTFAWSRPAGGAYLLRALWDRLNIRECLDKALQGWSF